MDARKYLIDQYGLDFNKPNPIEIPNQSRTILCTMFRDLGYKVGAEIGVETGKYSEVLLKTNPDLTLHCIDSWQSYDDYIDGINMKDQDVSFREAQERLKGCRVNFIKEFSMRALRRFENESLDFVYIDANHNLPYVMDDIIQWEKKVKHGGVVAGHDYIKSSKGRATTLRVVEAVNWYVELKPIKTWFLIGTKAKLEGEVRDSSRSWFWIKE